MHLSGAEIALIGKQVQNVYFFFFLKWRSSSQGHAPLTAVLIATLLARKDSGAAEMLQ